MLSLCVQSQSFCSLSKEIPQQMDKKVSSKIRPHRNKVWQFTGWTVVNLPAIHICSFQTDSLRTQSVIMGQSRQSLKNSFASLWLTVQATTWMPCSLHISNMSLKTDSIICQQMTMTKMLMINMIGNKSEN